jgi:Subtilase family
MLKYIVLFISFLGILSHAISQPQLQLLSAENMSNNIDSVMIDISSVSSTQDDFYCKKYRLNFRRNIFTTSTFTQYDTLTIGDIKTSESALKTLFNNVKNDLDSFVFISRASTSAKQLTYNGYCMKFESNIHANTVFDSLDLVNGISSIGYWDLSLSTATEPFDEGMNVYTDISNIQVSNQQNHPPHHHPLGWQWNLYEINAPLAWDISQGENGWVAMDDKFVDPLDKDELETNYNWKEHDELDDFVVFGGNYNNITSNIGDGLYDFSWYPTGYVVHPTELDNYGDPKKLADPHGMQTTSIVIAEADNGFPMIGVAPKAKAFGTEWSRGSKTAQQYDVDGVTGNGITTADVVNLSGGGGSYRIEPKIFPVIESGMVYVTVSMNFLGKYPLNGEGKSLITDLNTLTGDEQCYDSIVSKGSYYEIRPSSVRPALNNWSDPNDPTNPDEDIKVICVGALFDDKEQANCSQSFKDIYDKDGPMTGNLRINDGYNFSVGLDKFNRDPIGSTRAKERGKAFLDLVAPSGIMAALDGVNDPNYASGVGAKQGSYKFFQREYSVGNGGTSSSAPMVTGVVALMTSFNKGLKESGREVHKKAYDILTFTAEKILDKSHENRWTEIECRKGTGPDCDDCSASTAYFSGWSGAFPDGSPYQFQYVEQTNDRMKRWWAQRMGFGMVNAYRAVAHSIENKADYEITSNGALAFANNDGSPNYDARGYVSGNKQLLHMGSKAKEGVVDLYPFDDFWLIEDTRDIANTNAIVDVLKYGGASIPFLSAYHTDYESYNNQGVTVLNNASEVIKLNVGLNQILAIDGMLIGIPGNMAHDIHTAYESEDGLIMIEGYLRDVEVGGNLRVGDLIIDGSNVGAGINASYLWFGGIGTVSEVYGKVTTVNEGTVAGGGGFVTFQPGAELNLLGNRDAKLEDKSEWHFNSATKVFSATKKLILKSGSKIYIDEDKKVEFDIEVVVKACAELIVDKNALLKIKKLTVEDGGIFTVNEGGHVTFVETTHDLLGTNNFNGTLANPVILRANTVASCFYEDTELAGTNVTFNVCNTAVTDSPPELVFQNILSSNVLACDYDCPLDDSWLKLYSTKGDETCPNPSDCKITHKLNLPDKYICNNVFSHYTLNTTLNGVPYYTSEIQVYNGEEGKETFPEIDICINSGDTYVVTFTFMRSDTPDPANDCVVTQEATCECTCPADYEDWLTISSVKNSPSCSGDECLMSINLNIPSAYPCYTQYELITATGGSTNDSTGRLNLSGETFIQYDQCVPEGMTYQVILKLYNPNDPNNPCIITKDVFCGTDEDPVACLPDCFNDPFIPEDDIYLELTSCPGCVVKVSYSSRIACFGWQDIQITSIEKTPISGAPLTSCNGCSDTDVYNEAIYEIIARNAMGFDPKDKTKPCSDLYRVSKASCWATWNKVIIDPTNGNRTITLHKPCNSTCCLRRMRVCRTGENSVTIEDLGLVLEGDCDGETHTANYPPYEVINCIYTCDMLEDINVTYNSKISIGSSEAERYFSPNSPNAIVVEFNIKQDLNSLRFLIENTNATTASVYIYDLNGRLIEMQNSDLVNGRDSFTFDTSDYLTGAYLWIIVADGVKVSSNKFIIEK